MSKGVGFRFSTLLLMVYLALLMGCSGRLQHPENLESPVTFHLAVHGRHSSLILPHGEGVARYSYGEWQWYVEERRGVMAGVAAMLLPTKGALGRRIYADTPIRPFPERVAPEGTDRVFTLQAEADKVSALRRRLDRIFEARHEEATYSDVLDLEFVPYPRTYWLAHQSNLVTASWLRRLGYEVRGIPWLASWRIEQAE